MMVQTEQEELVAPPNVGLAANSAIVLLMKQVLFEK